jgi:hypothetical protein
VLVAVADLAEKVASLTLKLDRVAAVAKAVKSERVPTLMPFAHATETTNLDYQTDDFVTEATDAQAIDVAESNCFPLSPQQNSRACETAKNKIDLALGRDPKVVNRAEGDSIAARVLELHERLGGFIKSSLPQSSHRNTKSTD